MVLFSEPFYALDDPFVALNYGKIRIDSEGVQLSINDYDGHWVQRMNLTYADM